MGKSKGSAVSYCSDCDKRLYLNENDAHRERRSLARSAHKHRNKHGELTVYPCPHGANGWHIGHTTAAIDAV